MAEAEGRRAKGERREEGGDESTVSLFPRDSFCFERQRSHTYLDMIKELQCAVRFGNAAQHEGRVWKTGIR